MALVYELEVLEDIIFETVHPKALIEKRLEKKQLTDLMDLFVQENNEAIKRIRKTSGRLIRENRKAAYLRLQQAGMIRMMDALIAYLFPKDIWDIYKRESAETVEGFYKAAYVQLEAMLHLFKHDHLPYFDFDAKLPDGYKWKMERDMKETLEIIETRFEKKVSAAFFELICEPFEYFLSNDSHISYKELAYLVELRLYLLGISEQVLEQVEEKISERLLYLNFNSVLFFNYMIRKISDEASQKSSVNERVEYYSWQIKTLNQTRVKHNIIYLSHLEPIREQLIYWIAEDLYYLDKKHQLSLTLPMNREAQKDKLKKVHVQLTVAELALGARLLLDTDVIINTNYTELIKMVARGFRTNRQANISQQAIYNVGFDVTTNSKEKMKSILMRMVRKIGEY
jgi:hypothetical protein